MAWIILGVVIGVIRVWAGFALNHDQLSSVWFLCYKDAAHIYIGALGIAAWQDGSWKAWLFWGLCVLEVVVAILTRVGSSLHEAMG